MRPLDAVHGPLRTCADPGGFRGCFSRVHVKPCGQRDVRQRAARKRDTVEAVVEGLHHLKSQDKSPSSGGGDERDLFRRYLAYDPETERYQAVPGNDRSGTVKHGGRERMVFMRWSTRLPVCAEEESKRAYESDSELFYRVFHVFQDPHAADGLDEGELCAMPCAFFRLSARSSGACFIFGSILPGTAPEAFSGPLWRF